jgi:ketosteroid isomerase-like protein
LAEGLPWPSRLFTEPPATIWDEIAGLLRDTPREMPGEFIVPDVASATRRAFEAASRREIDLLVSLYAEDAVFDMSAMGLGRFEGREAIRVFSEDWIGAYDDFSIEVGEIVDFGSGVALAMVSQKGRMVGSEGVVDVRYAVVAAVSGGEIVITANYLDVEEARAAAESLAAVGWRGERS